MAQGIGDVKSFAICTQIQVARIRSIKISAACGYLANLSEERPGVHAKYMDRIFESIGDVKPRPVGVEECLFTVETSLESAEHGIIGGVDHTGKVCILIKDDGVLNGINAAIKWSEPNSDWSKTAGNSAGP